MWIDTLREFLGQPIDGSSLALFRCLFGVLICWSTIRRIEFMTLYYTSLDFYIKYRFFYWVKCPGVWAMRTALFILIVSLACFALGLFYHVSVFLALTLYTYIFLLDKAQFNNHFYLTILILFLFNFVNATQVFALDNLLFPAKNTSNQIPYWNVLIFQLQFAIVYTFGGVNKITADWLLRGQPMTMWFSAFTPKVEWDGRVLRYCFTESIAAKASMFFKAKYTGLIFSWLGMVFDLLIIWLMMIPETLPYALPFFIFFNLFNLWSFNIGVFPYMNLCAILLFLRPEFSRRIITIFQGEG